MSVIPSQSFLTPAELLDLADSVAFELVDGHVVERNMGGESSLVALTIGMLLRLYVGQHKLGLVFGADAGYQCFPDSPDKVRRADVSFISRDRLPNNAPPKGYIKIAPDLAVEVISPNDSAYEVRAKLTEYEAVGVRLIWVVYPLEQIIEVHRLGQSEVAELKETDTISGENILPGFSCGVAEFFKTGV